MTRIILVGSRSFIAGHVRTVAASNGFEAVAVGHDTPIAPLLRATDMVVNFSLDPAYRVGAYSAEEDHDLRAALACRGVGAGFIMLSTRRFYPAAERWGAKEASTAAGDETHYGRNKARSEAVVRDALQGRCAILRLSNIFGFEYDPAGSRRTFFGQALTSLRQTGRIVLDMHPDTRRDFLPVGACARAIIDCAVNRAHGTYNVGCGFPVRCGDIAQWVLDGYRGGEIVADNNEIRDEFYLNTDKWRSQFGDLVDLDLLQQCCADLGRRLR